MSFLTTHFYEGGTAEQYEATLAGVHPDGGGLPAGQLYHAAGPTEGGWLIAAVWESKESFDTFLSDVLMPKLPEITGGFAGPPQERTAEIANLVEGPAKASALDKAKELLEGAKDKAEGLFDKAKDKIQHRGDGPTSDS
jgi:hypothetical protein